MEPRFARFLIKQYISICFGFFAGLAFLFWFYMWFTLNQQGHLLLVRDDLVPVELGLFLFFGGKLIFDAVNKTRRILKVEG